MSSDPSMPTYHYVTRNTIVDSNEIADGVIADFDATGAVVGIEFLDSVLSGDVEKYIAMASASTFARLPAGRPPSEPLSRAS